MWGHSAANRQRQTPLARDAEAWQQAGQDRALLYTGRQLELAEEEMVARPNALSPLEREFIEAGTKAKRNQERQQRRLITAGVLLLIAVLLALTSWALASARRANVQATLAAAREAEAAAALVAERTSAAASQADTAELAQAQAKLAAQEANVLAARRTAEAEAKQAQIAAPGSV